MRNFVSVLIIAILPFIGILIPSLANAQTDSILSQLFYNLPLDSYRSFICKKIKTDKRFSEIRSTSDTGEYNISLLGATYYGKVLDKGIIKTRPDSIRIQVTSGLGGITGCSDCNLPPDTEKVSLTDITYVQCEYFYLDHSAMEESYIYLMSYLYSTGKKIECASTILTNMGKSGEGCHVYFNHSRLSIIKWNLPEYRYSLEIEYERSEI